jgi:hypothetical protein
MPNEIVKKKTERGFNQRVAAKAGSTANYVCMVLKDMVPLRGQKARAIIKAAQEVRAEDAALIEAHNQDN